MSEGTKFSIVVVTYECASALATLIDSMNAHLEPSVELVVVDNASTDDPLEVAQRWKGAGFYLQLDSNHGYGAAVNSGVEAATSPAVVVLNADIELEDDGLPALAAVALAQGALVGPRVLNPDGSAQPSASGPPIGAWPWLRALMPAGVGPRWAVARLHPWRLAKTTHVTWLTGCCVAGPRDVLGALGPFDPAIHMYGEDLDLGVRASKAGVPVIFEPGTCAVTHFGKASSSRVYDDLGRAEAARNSRAVLRRAYGARRETLVWLAERASLAIRLQIKRLAGRDVWWERLVANGLRQARSVPPLKPLPGDGIEPPAPSFVTTLGPPSSR